MKTSRKILFFLLAVCVIASLVPAKATAASAECEHAYTQETVYKPATCDTPGTEWHLYCPDCNKYLYGEGMGWQDVSNPGTFFDILPHTGEIIITHPGTATCQDSGTIEYLECSLCHKVKVGSNDWAVLTAEQIAAKINVSRDFTNHPNPDRIMYIPAASPTCIKVGYNSGYRICKDCDYLRIDDTPDWVADNSEAANSNVIPATNHPDEGLKTFSAAPATCTTNGLLEGYTLCNACKMVKLDGTETWIIQDNPDFTGIIIPAAHTVIDIPAVDPTCSTSGSIAYQKCTVCGWYKIGGAEWTALTEEELNAQVSVPAAHTISDVAAVAPTCSKTGTLAYKKCTACGQYKIGDADWAALTNDQLNEQIKVPVDPAAHPAASISINAGVAPDCCKTGTVAHQYCSACGKYKVGSNDWAVLTAEQIAALTLAKDPNTHAAGMQRSVAVKAADCSGGVKKAHIVCDGCKKVSTDGGATWVVLSDTLKAELYLDPVHDYSDTSHAVYNGNHTHSIPCKYSTAAAPHTAKTQSCHDFNKDNLCDICGSVINTNGGSGTGTGGNGTDPAFGTVYTMKEGSGASWINNSANGLKFVSSADFSKFVHVEIDGQVIAGQNYTAASGSTIVTLKSAYLKTLSVGKHTIKIVSTDGAALGEFTVKQGSPTVKTADESNMTLWIGVVAAATVTMGAVIVFDRKKHLI